MSTVNRGDLDALLKLYDPTGSLVQRDGGIANGHAAIGAVLGRLVAMRPHLSVKVVKVVRAGDDLDGLQRLDHVGTRTGRTADRAWRQGDRGHPPTA